MIAPALEKIVPNSIVADGWQRARVRARKARRRYWPSTPGTIASAWVDPASARSRPSTRARTKNDASDGLTTTVARPKASDFSERSRAHQAVLPDSVAPFGGCTRRS